MRVAVSAGFAPSLLNFRRDLLLEMKECGCEVFAFAPEDPAVRRELQSMGMHFVAAPVWPTKLNPLADWQYYLFLQRQLATIKPTSILAYTHKPVIFGLMAAAKARVRFRVALITGLGYAFTEVVGMRKRLANRIVRFLYRRALPRATTILFQNPDDQQLFREQQLLPKTTATQTVAGSGVNLEHYPFVSPPAGDVSFLMLSRLLVDKGVREYAAAAEEVRRKYPHVAFHLAGRVERGPAAIPAAEVQEWSSRGIKYHGDVADVRPLLASASVYVLPSYREGTPRSVLEAMSMGRPVITTDAPGCRETIREGENGYLVPVKDTTQLVERMERFIACPGQVAQMGRRSRQFAEQRFDVRKVNAVVLAALGVRLPDAAERR